MKPTKEEVALFKKMMKDVTPLGKAQKRPVHKKRPISEAQRTSHDVRPILTPLSDGIEFDIKPDEILSYFPSPLDKKIKKKFISGLIPFTARLDLHQMNREEAHYELDHFLQKVISAKHRCCLIIHGKGKGTLKNLTFRWLKQYESVLAIHSARPSHGGAGALYVYLKRSKR